MKQEKRFEISNELIKKDPLKFANFLDYIFANDYKVLIWRSECSTVVEFGLSCEYVNERVVWLGEDEYVAFYGNDDDSITTISSDLELKEKKESD